MPSYRGHLMGGVITYLGVLHFIKYTNPNVHVIVQGLLFCLLGSLFPDVDIKSKGQKIFYTILLCFLTYCLALQRWDLFAVLSILGVVPLLVRHRGIFHSIWFLLSLTLVAMTCIKMWYSQYETILIANSCFFFAGCLSHVLLDRTLTSLKRY